MSPGQHAAGDGSFARSAGGAATRGIILIVVAVLIGVVLIATAVDDNNQVTSGATSTAPPGTTADTTPGTDPPATTPGDTSATTAVVPDTTAASTPTSAGDATTTTVAGAVFEPRPNSVVSVQVANTTRVGGAAGRMTDTVKAQGYVSLTAVTDTGGVQAITKIHHQGGYLLEAQKLAGTLGLDPEENVFSLPSNPSATIDEYLDPNILILLGSDLAN
jgi:hypothetical protein